MKMGDLSQQRNEGWKIHIVDEFPKLSDITDNVILGTFAWTCLSRKEKWIDQKHAIDYGFGWSTPGDIARDYLSVKGYKQQRRRMTTAQYKYFVTGRKQAPLYARKMELENGVYLDLKSAYWSILRVVGWNCDYNPGLWLGVGDTVEDFPFSDHKLARNCLVTVGINGSMNVWDGGKIISIKKRNPFSNSVLFGLVLDVLNGIAKEMVDAGAIYVHTDGYILDALLEHTASHIITGWGLSFGMRFSGRTTVRGVADYDIGDRKSRIKRLAVKEFDSVLDKSPNFWLKSRFCHWAINRGVNMSLLEYNMW